jgi:hypothetical protein
MDRKIQFWWQPPLTTGGPFGIAAYTLSDGSNTFSLGPTNRTFIVTGLTNGTPYTFTITAQNTNGDTSDPATFRTVQPGSQPGPPSGPTAVVRSNTSALVSWTPAASDGGSAIGWYVIESASTGNPVVKVSALSTDTSQTVEGLTTGETYTFKVYSVNDVKYSEPAITAPLTISLATLGSTQFTYTQDIYSGSLDPQKLIMSPGVTFGDAQFTIDFWMYPTSRGSFDGDYSEGAGILGCGFTNTNAITLFFYHWTEITLRHEGTPFATNWTLNGGNPITLNQWHHIAITRVNTLDEFDNPVITLTAWYDGTRVGDPRQQDPYSDYNATDPTIYVGFNAADRTYDMSGNLSDLRIVIGTAVYDNTQTTITVPTAPLENVTGTQVLLHMASSETWLTDTAGVQTVTADAGGALADPVWVADAPF